MIVRIAFKNIWRNKLRSWTVIIATALGIFGGLAVISTATGLTDMRQNNAIRTYVSHIQIHDSAYLKYGGINDQLQNDQKIINGVSKIKQIKGVSSRLKVESFIQSAGGTSGLILNGINPNDEALVTDLHKKLQKGNYLETYKRKPPILISQRTAKKLNAKIKTSIQCSFTDSEGLPAAGVFKVVDIFQTSNSMYDDINAFVRIEDLKKISGLDGSHEIAITVTDDNAVEQLKTNIEKMYPKVHVASWRSIAPELGYADKMMDLVMMIFLIIIMLALAFGIVNTMLMAVLERKKEIGMLISVGMNKRKVFWMIVWESIFLAFIAGPLGIVVSFVTIQFLGRHGIDLSFAAEGLRSVGLESTIFPSLNPTYYVIISVLVVTTAILSCLYPALKALKLNPAETLRTA